MKLDTSKIKENVAIHCPKKEYVRELFEAMGWDDIEIGERHWEDYKENTCYTLNKGWHYSNREWYQSNGYTIIPFTDLIIEEKQGIDNLIIALNAVRNDLKLKAGVQFSYRKKRYRITETWIDVWNDIVKCWQNVTCKVIVNMIKNPFDINIFPKWTPEEQEMAKKDNFRFGWVCFNASGTQKWLAITCWGTCNESFGISMIDYPSLKPGECVSLNEIAGGGE